TFYITAGLKSTTELWDDQMQGEVDPNIKTNINWTYRENNPLSVYATYNYALENNEEHCMLGGSTTTGFTPIDDGFTFNIAQNNFVMKQPLPINLMGSSGGFTKILERSPDGEIIQRVVLAGGITDGPALTNQTWIFTDTVNVSDVSEISNTIPQDYSLSQNYPNPFNPTTNIEYSIPEASFVQLKVYDILGNEVTELVNEVQSDGTYRADFSGSNLASGLYIAKLQAGSYHKTIKMSLLK
ncbi:MAG: T9SS type A sorting domain-containing protein, partial [Ignavibacteriaceae bacterium]